MRVAVVGAGIVGLATAVELNRSPGVEVRCYDAGTPMAARSLGGTRIFRTAHAEPRMVSAAVRALELWRGWEAEFDVPLVGREGVVVSGEPALERARAMQAAGVEVRLVGDGDTAGGVPAGLPARRLAGPAVVDPLGGVLQARASGAALLGALGPVVRREDPVASLDVLDGGLVRVRAASGDWDCDAAVVAAGAGTADLVEPLGIAGVPHERRHHHRFSFRLTNPEAQPPCWLEQAGAWRPGFTTYQHLAGPGLWAVGGSLGDQDTDWELGVEETRRRATAALTAYVRETLTGVDNEIVETVSCDSIGTGDGVGVGRSGPVVALWGDNLFKLAPLLGALLARSATSGALDDQLTRLR